MKIDFEEEIARLTARAKSAEDAAVIKESMGKIAEIFDYARKMGKELRGSARESHGVDGLLPCALLFWNTITTHVDGTPDVGRDEAVSIMKAFALGFAVAEDILSPEACPISETAHDDELEV